MTSEDRQRTIAELAAERAAIIQKLSWIDSQRLSWIDGLIETLKTETAGENGTQPEATSIYSNAKSLFEMSKICLKSVNGAGLSPIEIADRLIEANAVGSPHGLSGHIGTALKRRMNSPRNPDREIEVEDGRYYYRPARPMMPSPHSTVQPAQAKTMSKREVCEYLGKSKRTVETYISDGRLPVKYFNGPNGKTAEFQRADVDVVKRACEEVWERNINPVNQKYRPATEA